MFYEFLDRIGEMKKAVVCTIIDGPNIGEQCLFENNEKMAQTEHFPSAFCLPVSSRDTGIVKFEGTSIFTEVLKPSKSVVICGAGHVALAVIRILKMLDMKVTVLEDRASFAEEAVRNGADCVLIGEYKKNLQNIENRKEQFYLVMTRGHRFDMECLEEILADDFSYVGMMSSKMRAGTAVELMRKKGISEEKLKQLHSPIGFKIGAETPEEIAVSVAAEIISELHEISSGLLSKEMIGALLDPRERVLAEIVKRRGPAPRKPGTKMVIFRDGSITGTIGGGCFEAQVIRMARDLMMTEGHSELVTVDLTEEGQDANDGMACGGVIDVLLKVLPEDNKSRNTHEQIHI